MLAAVYKLAISMIDVSFYLRVEVDVCKPGITYVESVEKVMNLTKAIQMKSIYE